MSESERESESAEREQSERASEEVSERERERPGEGEGTGEGEGERGTLQTADSDRMKGDRALSVGVTVGFTLQDQDLSFAMFM